MPNGCRHDGGARRALKSIALIGTLHSHGPMATPSTITSRINAPTSASRWRLKRRQMSWASETGFALLASSNGLTEADARVEPAIEDVRQEIEADHQARKDEGDGHDDGRVVREDGADQQRTDAGNAEDLLGDDGAAEDRGSCSATSVTTGISALRTTCLMITARSFSPFERAVVT